MCKCICSGFFDFMIKGKSLSNYTTFSPNKYQRNDQKTEIFSSTWNKKFILWTDSNEILLMKKYIALSVIGN